MEFRQPSFLRIIIVASLASLVNYQTLPAQSNAARVDALFKQWDRPDSPGCAVSVMKGGKIIYSHGYGMADLDHGIKITPTTVFHVASMSKQFTAASILLLAQQGKLSLDDNIRKYIPELP